MKLLFLLGAVSVLSGCLATTNLLQGETLSPDDLATAKIMATKMQTTCFTTRYKGPDETAQGAVKITALPEVRALYKSDSGWIKADLASAGIFDSVFYAPSLGQFVCGQIPWSKSPQSSSVQFKKVSTPDAPSQAAGPAPAPIPKSSLLASRIGAFEVGRMPGDYVGAYAALTGRQDELFGRVCTVGTCKWVLMAKANCETNSQLMVIFSADNKASQQPMTCVAQGAGAAGLVFSDSEEAVTPLIFNSKQIGFTLPDGRAFVFNVNGAASAATALEKMAQLQ